MTRRYFSFIIALCVTTAEAFDLVVPGPEEMLTEANLVAVAHISKTTPYLELEVDEILKGDLHAGDRRSISSSFPPMAFSLQSFGNLIGNERFLFVGRFSSEEGVVYPSFGFGSAWPQGDMKKRILPTHSLEECVRFAREKLTASELRQIGAPPRGHQRNGESSPKRGSEYQIGVNDGSPHVREPQSSGNSNSGRDEGSLWRVLGVGATLGIATMFLLFLIQRRRITLRK